MKGEGLLVPLDGGFHLEIGLVADAVVEEVQADLRRGEEIKDQCLKHQDSSAV